MTVSRLLSRSAEETERVGREIGRLLAPGSVVLLTGPIGAGKSVLARGIGVELGVTRWRGSPTFTLVNEYPTDPPLYHIDLYRLGAAAVEDLGLDEYLNPSSVAIIEWADRAEAYLAGLTAGSALGIDIRLLEGDQREIEISGVEVPASMVRP
jgi:tRNA threonylcarbamoyladenosine biosynthesis protein TsaE